MKRSGDGGSYQDYDDNPKRRFKVEDDDGNDEEGNREAKSAADKVSEYVRELITEKSQLHQEKLKHAARLLDQEISNVQSMGRIPPKEFRYVNLYRERPIKVTTKVLVPVREHPKFNFVGKLLGPKGNSLKRLQEETMCKMSILGKGSMKDLQKEEDLKASKDPKYAHLFDDLHVEISAFGPPAEAHARMAFALAEVRKYLIPDKNDSIRQEQLRELESLNALPPNSSKSYRDPMMKSSSSRAASLLQPPPVMRTATRTPVITPRVMPAKAKIMSILDRARMSMEDTYAYEDPYSRHSGYTTYGSVSPPPSRYEEIDYSPEYYRKSSSHYGEPSSHRWKPSSPVERNPEGSRYRSVTQSRSSMKPY